jgi:NADH-quinone oxidoreductase subunit M
MSSTGFPWITVLGAIPLIGIVGVLLLPRDRDEDAKRVALGASIVTLIASIWMAADYHSDGARFQFVQSYDWIEAFGAHYAVGVDGIALALILMTTALTPIILLASWHDATDVDSRRGSRTFFALLLATETIVIGVFGSLDVFLFYVLFEAMLIPIYFLIGTYGGPRRSYAAVKFLLYSLFGGLLMLAAVIGLYVVSANAGHGTFLFDELTKLHIQPTTAKWLFLGFFVAFAIKAPLVPFHTWLPDAAGQAPAGAAVLLVGVLDKVGTYGMLRFCIELFPGAAKWFTPVVLTLSVIGIVYGAVLAIGQIDIKRLIAYTSISHFGFITLGIFAMTTQGQTGATLYMVNHGFSTGALFLVAGVRRSEERRAAAGRHVPRRGPVRPVAAGTLDVRVGVPGARGHVHALQGAGDHRHDRHHPGRRLHPVDVPAHDDRADDGEGRGDAGPVQA